MDSAQLQQADLDKLNDKDKAELRQFLTNNEQRARIQSRAQSLPFLQSLHLSLANKGLAFLGLPVFKKRHDSDPVGTSAATVVADAPLYASLPTASRSLLLALLSRIYPEG